MTHPHREFNTDRDPLGYLITFRAYGTWLHGDSRGSVDRFHNRYASPLIPPNRPGRQHNERYAAQTATVPSSLAAQAFSELEVIIGNRQTRELRPREEQEEY